MNLIEQLRTENLLAVPNLIGTCREAANELEHLTKSIEYWQADSAAAWGKCEERRLENERLTAERAELNTLLGKASSEVARLATERDMLVEALENLRDTKGRYHTEQAYVKAMEALAKVKK